MSKTDLKRIENFVQDLDAGKPSENGAWKMERTLYKVSSAMLKLDVCRATVYRMAARGELDIVKIGLRATRVTAESINRAIAAGMVKR